MRLMPGSRRMARADSPTGELPKLLTIAALSTTLIAAAAARIALQSEAFLAVVTTALFACAATAALAAWLMHRRASMRLGWLDLAGIFTCIGIVVSMMIEPEQVAQFVTGAPRGK
jgi:predicted PurR-regulated permease PerM